MPNTIRHLSVAGVLALIASAASTARLQITVRDSATGYGSGTLRKRYP